MPLHLKTVTPALKEILYELMDCSLFKPFRLVGGTNLCLRFGYRLSSDIDLLLMLNTKALISIKLKISFNLNFRFMIATTNKRLWAWEGHTILDMMKII